MSYNYTYKMREFNPLPQVDSLLSAQSFKGVDRVLLYNISLISTAVAAVLGLHT